MNANVAWVEVDQGGLGVVETKREVISSDQANEDVTATYFHCATQRKSLLRFHKRRALDHRA